MTALVNLPPIHQKATFDLTFDIEDENGNTLDITGAAIYMELREAVDDEDAVASWSTVSGEFTVDGPGGNFSLLVVPEDTENIPVGDYLYDILFVHNTTDIIIAGRVSVKRPVTRPA